MTIRLGVVAVLPPTPTGPADYVAALLPAMARLGPVTCFVPDPSVVAPHLREAFDVRPIHQRHDGSTDLLVYHVANNTHHTPLLEAAMSGPPGLLVIHDGSLHHLIESHTLGSSDEDAYRLMLTSAHGERGALLAENRIYGARAGVELFLFDLMGPLLDRHLGAIVHNQAAADLVTMRAPGLPVWKIAHHAAFEPPPLLPRSVLGLPADRFIVGHFGFVGTPKRPFLIVDAFTRLLARGIDAHLLFAGQDETGGEIYRRIRRLGIADRVTITGYLSEQRLEELIVAVDAVVSLRWPQVAESSGTLVRAMVAGRPIVVQHVGSWAEIPETAAIRVPAEGDEAEHLANAFERLAADPALARRLSESASEHAHTKLSADACAAALQSAATEVVNTDRRTPVQIVGERTRRVRAFLDGGAERVREVLDASGSILAYLVGHGHEHPDRYHHSLSALPPARPGGRLLDIGPLPALLPVLAGVWGYEVSACNRWPQAREFEFAATPGVPAYSVRIDPVDVERDPFPYETGSFDVVLCWEVLEHLGFDPLFMLREANRVLRPGGLLILTTPNVVSLRSVRAVLDGYQPFLWAQFQRSGTPGHHEREYAPVEVRSLLSYAGFSTDSVQTVDAWGDRPAHVEHVLTSVGAGTGDRGDSILVRARKASMPEMERYPADFYQ